MVISYMIWSYFLKSTPQYMPIKFFAFQVSGDRQELGKLSDEVLQQGRDHR